LAPYKGRGRVDQTFRVHWARKRAGAPPSAGRPVATFQKRPAGALLDSRAPDLPLTIREQVLAEAKGNSLALVEVPSAWTEQRDRDLFRDWLPLTTRLERAFAACVEQLPETTRLLIAALADGGCSATEPLENGVSSPPARAVQPDRR
jgi:hypothetical protein